MIVPHLRPTAREVHDWRAAPLAATTCRFEHARFAGLSALHFRRGMLGTLWHGLGVGPTPQEPCYRRRACQPPSSMMPLSQTLSWGCTVEVVGPLVRWAPHHFPKVWPPESILLIHLICVGDLLSMASGACSLWSADPSLACPPSSGGPGGPARCPQPAAYYRRRGRGPPPGRWHPQLRVAALFFRRCLGARVAVVRSEYAVLPRLVRALALLLCTVPRSRLNGALVCHGLAVSLS